MQIGAEIVHLDTLAIESITLLGRSFARLLLSLSFCTEISNSKADVPLTLDCN